MGIRTWWWPCLILLLQACLVNAGEAQGTGQLLGFTTRKDKLIRPDKNGKIIILDVSSLHPQSSGDITPFGTQDWCAEACNRVPDCNAFAFCNDPKGCGTDCARHTAEHPQMAKVTPKAGSGYPIPEPTWNGQKTFDRLGPFGKTAQCYGPKPPMIKTKPPQPGDQPWTFGTCTLLKLDNPGNRMFASQKASKGWVSGYALQPTGCQPGISNNTCTECKAFSDPAKCMTCAKKAFADLPLLQAAFRPEDPVAECSYPVCDKNAGSDKWESCLQGWVGIQIRKQGEPGVLGGCGSLGPMYYDQCITRWIWDNLPGARSTCKCEPFDKIKACLYGVVDDRMQGRPLVNSSQPSGNFVVLDSSCQMLAPATAVRQCYTDTVIREQKAAASGGMGVDNCASVSQDKQTTCTNAWVLDYFPAAGRCAFIESPTARQSCIDDVIDDRRQCDYPPVVEPSPDQQSPAVVTPKKLCADVSADEHQRCVNSAVHDTILANLPAGYEDRGCWVGTTNNGPWYDQACVNQWITNNGGKMLAPVGTSPSAPRPRHNEGCDFTAEVSQEQLAKMVQSCYNGVAERLIAAVAKAPPRPVGKASSSCASQDQEKAKACWNAWVNEQMMVGQGPVADIGGGCYSDADGTQHCEETPVAYGCALHSSAAGTVYQQKCIVDWIQANLDDPLRTVEPTLPDRCWVTPSGNYAADEKQRQDCYYALVEEAMVASTAGSGKNAPAPNNPSTNSPAPGGSQGDLPVYIMSCDDIQDPNTHQACIDSTAHQAFMMNGKTASPPISPADPAYIPAVIGGERSCEGIQDWDSYQACIQDYVNTKVLAERPVQNMNGSPDSNLPTGPGLGCLVPATSNGGKQTYHDNCVMSWIWDNIPEALPKCGCEVNPNDFGNVKSCLYGLVLDTMEGRPITLPPTDPNRMVSGCIIIAPEERQQCWNDALKNYMRDNKQDDCSKSAAQQYCLNHWATQYLPKAGRCLLKPSQEAVQACINDAIDHIDHCPTAAPANQAPPA